MSAASTNRDIEFYADPSVYDILHTPGTADEVDVLEGVAETHVDRPLARQVWLEPACGSGRFLRVVAGRGRRIYGFDINPSMVAYARDRLRNKGLSRRGHVFEADMARFARELQPGSIHFAFNTINTIRHLNTDTAMLDHFRQMHTVLASGGIYAVGVSLSAYGIESPSEDVWEGSRGRCRVHQVVQYLPPEPRDRRIERVVTHLTIARPGGTEHLDTSYGLRTYNRRQWRRLVYQGPLDLVGVVNDHGRAVQDHDGLYVVYLLGRS